MGAQITSSSHVRALHQNNLVSILLGLRLTRTDNHEADGRSTTHISTQILVLDGLHDGVDDGSRLFVTTVDDNIHTTT
jgi:hypothetical protein